jgi:hypothetical protein
MLLLERQFLVADGRMRLSFVFGPLAGRASSKQNAADTDCVQCTEGAWLILLLAVCAACS